MTLKVMSSVFFSEIVSSIGRTPVSRLNKLVAGLTATFWVKTEFLEPLASVKDRIGKAILEAAEREGKVRSGTVSVEPTSGNAGIARAIETMAPASGAAGRLKCRRAQTKAALLFREARLSEVVVETGVEPVNGSSRIDLQSTPFGHLDTPPSKNERLTYGSVSGFAKRFFAICESEQPRLPEAVEARAAWVGGGPAENDMIEEFDVDRLGGLAELAGHLDIGGARCRIAAGVIVRADHPGGPVADGLAENLPRVGEAVGGGAGGDLDELKQTVFCG